MGSISDCSLLWSLFCASTCESLKSTAAAPEQDWNRVRTECELARRRKSAGSWCCLEQATAVKNTAFNLSSLFPASTPPLEIWDLFCFISSCVSATPATNLHVRESLSLCCCPGTGGCRSLCPLCLFMGRGIKKMGEKKEKGGGRGVGIDQHCCCAAGRKY